MNSIIDADVIAPAKSISPNTDDKNYHRLGWGVLIVLVGVFGIWSVFAPLESAIPATGKVIVASKNRVIQHLEGGIVKSVRVKDGDEVKEGDILIELDQTQSVAQIDVVKAAYYHALALQARLIAERNHAAAVTFSPEFYSGEGKQYINEANNQQREFESRKKSLTDDIFILEQRLNQLQYQVEGLQSMVKGKESLLKTYQEETKELETLYKQQLIDKIRLRDAQRQLYMTQSEISSSKSDINRAQSQISEVKGQITAAKETFMKNVLAELSDTQTSLADSRARLAGLKDVVKRSKIVAPTDGTVTALEIHTVGGIAPQGKPLMEIVPAGENLIIEAKLLASDVSNVRVGLRADIQFASFAHVKTLHEVTGEVIHVGADAMEDENHNLLYPVKVKITKEGRAELAKNKLVLQPGMPASVMIVVAERTLADYLIHPLKQMLRASFNEQ